MTLLVGITQRVIFVAGREEWRDALDQSWVSFLHAIGVEMVPIPNCHPDPVSFAKRLGIRGLILSGGNNLSQMMKKICREISYDIPVMEDISPERDITEIALLKESITQGWPVLGVCRGMQMLNVFHGGKLSFVKGHAGTKHLIEISEQYWHQQPHVVSDDMVNSYHNYVVLEGDLASELQAWARTADGTIEAFVHAKLPHYGIMWHPERYEEPRKNDRELFRYVFQEQEV